MEVVRELREDSLDAAPEDIVDSKVSNLHPPDDRINQSDSQQSASLYTMACDESLMSRQVDGWLHGDGSSIHTAGVQGASWPTAMHRSTLATDTQASFSGTGLWYMVAFMMPLLNIADANRWRCSQNAILSFMELISTQMISAFCRLRCNIRSLAHNQVTRDIFATAMDVVLVLYAIGFLILSVYQAAIFA